MKVLIDTNIILDVLSNRKEFVDDSSKVFKLCEIKRIIGYVSALSIPNLVYILRKELNKDKVKNLVEKLMLIFDIVELKEEDIKQATELNFTDYEDAIQSCQASRLKLDFIITRNIKDYKNSKVKAVNPSELLENILLNINL